MPVEIKCEECGNTFSVIPARKETAKFCSRKCRGIWTSKNIVGSSHFNWVGGERVKQCKRCGVDFTLKPTEAISSFNARMFCCKHCADIGGKKLVGPNSPRWTGGKNPRHGSHAKWAKTVISRDHAKCTACGATGVELQAHHIRSWKDNVESRFDVNNGITLCCVCHWNIHSAMIANGVNSVNVRPGGAEDNTEPSLGGNTLEGVTTRGRAYRRWEGKCHWCGVFMSRRLSDITGKAHVFCGKHCMGKHAAAFRPYRTWNNADIPPTAVIPSTSAPGESHDIV